MIECTRHICRMSRDPCIRCPSTHQMLSPAIAAMELPIRAEFISICGSNGHLDDGPLLGGDALQRLHDQPGALVVLDVGANLADHLRIAERVQVVVLDLFVATALRRYYKQGRGSRLYRGPRYCGDSRSVRSADLVRC